MQWAYEVFRCVELAFQKNINFVVGSLYALNDPLLKNMQRRSNTCTLNYSYLIIVIILFLHTSFAGWSLDCEGSQDITVVLTTIQ